MLNKINIISLIFRLFLCYIVIKYSEVPIGISTTIFLLVVTIIVEYNYTIVYKFIKKTYINSYQKILLYLCYVYFSFSFVGQRIFLYPFDKNITLQEILIFVIITLWSIKTINCLMYIFSNFHFFEYKLNKVNIKFIENKKNYYIFLFFISLFPSIVALYSLNPGNSSPDTYSCMITTAKHLMGAKDWHPVFYCIILRILESILDTTYIVIIFHLFFWVYVILKIVILLTDLNVNKYIILLLIIFLGVNPANFVHLVTIWKDIPYALSLLLATVCLAHFINYKDNVKWSIYFDYIVAMVGVFFYRQNGIIPFILIFFFVILFFAKNIKLIISSLILISIILIIKFPLYNYLQVQKANTGGQYIGLGQDILGVYYSKGIISNETKTIIDVLTNKDDYHYKPTFAESTYDLDVTPTFFIKCYLNTFINNPTKMTRAIINRQDAIFDIFLGKNSDLGCVNYRDTMDGRDEWNNYYPKRVDVIGGKFIRKCMGATSKIQIFNILLWRTGIYIFIAFSILISFVATCKNHKKYLIIYVPLIGQILSLILSTGWSDFRYYWPLNLLTVFISIFLIKINNKEAL